MRIFAPKRDGLMVILLATAALFGALGYYYWGSWRQAQPVSGGNLPTLPDIQVPEANDLKAMAALRTQLNRLAYPRASVDQSVQLGLFGYTPASRSLHQGRLKTASAGPAPAAFAYELSFALSAGPQQLCMLDGKLYSREGRLPDDARIVTIEPYRVLIEKNSQRRWIYLQAPPPGGEAAIEARAQTTTSSEDG